MDKLVGRMAEKLMKAGETKAPIKSLKIKVKFQKPASVQMKEKLARKMK